MSLALAIILRGVASRHFCFPAALTVVPLSHLSADQLSRERPPVGYEWRSLETREQTRFKGGKQNWSSSALNNGPDMTYRTEVPLEPEITAMMACAMGLVVVVLTMIARPVWAAGDEKAGAQIFKAKCERCHGDTAKGDGPDLKKLQAATTPGDWTDKGFNASLRDDFIVSMITKGGKANGKSPIMPSFQGKLTERQIQDLLVFIRSLPE